MALVSLRNAFSCNRKPSDSRVYYYAHKTSEMGIWFNDSISSELILCSSFGFSLRAIRWLPQRSCYICV